MKNQYKSKKLRILFLTLFMVLSTFSLIIGVSDIFSKKVGIKVIADTGNTIYFDLAAGNVTIGKTSYSGKVFVNGVPKDVLQKPVDENTKYYIYQSNPNDKDKMGYLNETDYNNGTNLQLPTYPRVTYNGQKWTDYITNNTKVKEVSRNWETAASDSHRVASGDKQSISNEETKPETLPTGNRITFLPDGYYKADVTIDNLWTYYQYSGKPNDNVRNKGGITAHFVANREIEITIRLKGDNRFGNIHYGANLGTKNKMIFMNGEDEGKTEGSLTVVDFPEDFTRNHWCSAIGGDDDLCDRSDGIVIESGCIYAGTTPEDNCTAIGGGGNQYGRVTINGGTVTAVASTTGTAIGGGIGWNGQGGNADITITKGTVYAYNFGVDNSSSDRFEHYVPAVAIGGGSSQNSSGNAHTNIDIQGGFVYAQCMGGAAIGGGGSAKKSGGGATINISGGTVIAKSTKGTFKGTMDPDTVNIPAGVSIGGGTGLDAGGSVNLTISGENTIVRTGSIGGGNSTGKDEHGNPNPVGSATVTISGGNIIGQIVMASGAANSCSFTMTGGVIHSTNVIDGVTIGNTNITGVTVTDPQPGVPISFIRDNGGAVFMNDPDGKATITGGLIGNCTANNGGAVYMTGGQFILSGSGQLGTNHAYQDGGSVYVGGGTVEIGGKVMVDGIVYEGTDCAIRNSDAKRNGGGVYVSGNPNQEGATVTMIDGEVHHNTATNDGGGMYIASGKVDYLGGSFHDNIADNDGGGLYVAGDVHMLGGSVSKNQAKNNGGGFCVEDGIVLMYGGQIDHNTAVNYGGGLHIAANTKPAMIDIFSGSISQNKAKMGGGVSVVSSGEQPIDVTVGVNCAHPDLDYDTRNFTSFTYVDDKGIILDCGPAHKDHTHNHIDEVVGHSSCPSVIGNVATEDGGGFFLSSNQSFLDFYCIVEQGNIANGNKQCYNMDVQGGEVNIGDKTFEPNPDDPNVKAKGNILMQSTIFVEAGKVDVWGEMDNPKFIGDVSVDIKDPDRDHYIDHRLTDEAHDGYKVHYYENFKDASTGKVSGLYIARQYPDPAHEHLTEDQMYKFTIMPSIFVRPGYKIVGWYSEPDGTGDEYKVNATFDLKELEKNGKVGHTNSAKEEDKSLLVLYAKWEQNGYILNFNPNVGEGEPYTGTMDNQRVTVGVLDNSQTINENLFKRPGYAFVGWALTPTPSSTDKIYADKFIINSETDFTKEDGKTIYLYAQWKKCNHDNLIYTAEENVLTQSCADCSGHTATAKITAVNATYDTKEHKATVVFSTNWIGNKPELSYDMAADTTWDAIDTVDDNWTSTSIPVHAGTYTAKVAAGEVVAQAEYTIKPIKWETPEVPVVQFSVQKVGTTYNSIITIKQPTGEKIVYLIKKFDLVNKTEIDVENYIGWQTSNQFTNIPYGHYYYFYAKESADRDHLESDSSKSSAFLTTGGNVIYIENGTGIKVVPKSGAGDFEYTVSADEGYHLKGYQDNLTSNEMIIGPDNKPDFVKPIPGVESADAYLLTDGIVITRAVSTGTYTYTVKLINEKVAYHSITLKFNGAAKDVSIAHKGIDGQVFSDFNGKDIIISQDSAFTVQFTINDYIPEEYKDKNKAESEREKSQALYFSQKLPIGTTIILKTNGQYWYYKLTEAQECIYLTDFTAMGGNEYYSYPTTGASPINFTYQFIVDFSQVQAGLLENDTFAMCLGLTANSDYSAPSITIGDTDYKVSLAIKAKASFEMIPSVSGSTATLTCTYNASAGNASILNGKDSALVLTAPSTIPADATITVVVDGKTILYRMNASREFIIPLGAISSKEVKVTLNSNLLNASQDYTFDAQWFVSLSGVDKWQWVNPDGYMPLLSTSKEFTLTCQKAPVPSLRIDGTTHRCQPGGTLNLTVHYANIPTEANGGKITAYLQSKNESGQYIDTGLKESISIDDSHEKQVSFNMGQMDKGSYRIYVIVQVNGENILTVPYYFVIA